MTSEEQQFFENARSLFLTDGWKDFMKSVENNIDSMFIDNLENETAFWMAKGQLIVLRSILGYENMVLAAEQAAEEDDDA
jgi:hypothetical protein